MTSIMKPLHEVRSAFDRHCSFDPMRQQFCLRPQDVQLALWELDTNPYVGDLNHAIVESDRDGSGVILWPDFKRFYAEFYTLSCSPQRSCSHFRVLDVAGRGIITKDELKAYITADPDSGCSGLDFEKFWHTFGADGRDDVSCAEYCQIVCPEAPREQIWRHVEIFYPGNLDAQRMIPAAVGDKSLPPSARDGGGVNTVAASRNSHFHDSNNNADRPSYQQNATHTTATFYNDSGMQNTTSSTSGGQLPQTLSGAAAAQLPSASSGLIGNSASISARNTYSGVNNNIDGTGRDTSTNFSVRDSYTANVLHSTATGSSSSPAFLPASDDIDDATAGGGSYAAGSSGLHPTLSAHNSIRKSTANSMYEAPDATPGQTINSGRLSTGRLSTKPPVYMTGNEKEEKEWNETLKSAQEMESKNSSSTNGAVTADTRQSTSAELGGSKSSLSHRGVIGTTVADSQAAAPVGGMQGTRGNKKEAPKGCCTIM